jgi:hypothetical protein
LPYPEHQPERSWQNWLASQTEWNNMKEKEGIRLCPVRYRQLSVWMELQLSQATKVSTEQGKQKQQESLFRSMQYGWAARMKTGPKYGKKPLHYIGYQSNLLPCVLLIVPFPGFTTDEMKWLKN